VLVDNYFFNIVVPDGIKNLTSIMVTDKNNKVLARFKRGRAVTLKEDTVINGINIPRNKQGFIEEIIPKKDTNSSKIKLDFGSLISDKPIELSLIKLCHYIAL